jgi:hypothetical protein
MPDTLDTASVSTTREWLFKDGVQVYGPVPEARLVELLLEGRVRANTLVAGEDGAWRALGDVPGFLVHLRKAEARARVEAEVTGAARIARRRWSARARSCSRPAGGSGATRCSTISATASP